MSKLVCPICKVGLLNGKYFYKTNIACECCECFKEIAVDVKYYANIIKEEQNNGKNEKTN